MKNNQIAVILLVTFSLFFFTSVLSAANKGEKTMIKYGEQCLAIMEKAALEMSVRGVALIAFIPGDTTLSWTSKMRVVGAMKNASANYLAIAYSKAGEMADTHKDSGSKGREALHGEFGYKGGVIIKVESGFILAVFSGASGEEDAAIARAGVACLLEHF